MSNKDQAIGPAFLMTPTAGIEVTFEALDQVPRGSRQPGLFHGQSEIKNRVKRLRPLISAEHWAALSGRRILALYGSTTGRAPVDVEAAAAWILTEYRKSRSSR